MDEIWFYGQNGVQHTDNNGGIWNMLNIPGLLEENIISTLFLPEKQLIYFGSIDKVIRYNFQNVKLIPTTGTAKLDRQLTHIFKEEDGTLWFGGNDGKVTKFAGGQFEDYSGLNYPNAFFPNIEHINRIDGKIWASTYGSDLMQIDGSDITVQTLVPNNPYLCFAQAPDGDIWVGCDYGIIQNPGPNQVWHIPWNNGFSGNITHDIDFDSQGRLWVATDNALHRFTGTNWIWYHSSNTVGAPDGTGELEIDESDNIWMIEKDIYKFDGDSVWLKYSLEDWGLPASAVPSSIFIDENGYVWVSTWYDGLVRFNPMDESFLVINQANSPLGDNGIRTVSTDEMGGLWIAMNGHDGMFYFGVEAPTFTNNLEVPSKTLQVFPNPANTSVEIMAEDGNEISNVILLDSSGRKLSIATGHYFSYTMDLSQLPKGLYFIVAQTGQILSTAKLIKY
ncbi:MAG: T9SS type A sorting domain-containing protein [Saprospiraceae bacterium]|nr:T9SS type A sorting domain-containing protein [Saprospiraceae bacterium]